MTDRTKKILGCGSALLCEIFFGFSFLFTKKAVGCVHLLDLLAWRFFTGLCFLQLCILFRFVRVDLKNKPILPLLRCGILFPGFYFVLEAAGVSRLTASETGILVACVPALTLLLGRLILKEHPRKLQKVGILVTIIGAFFCVAVNGFQASFDAKGYLFIGLALLSFSLFAVFSKKAEDYTSIEKTWFMLVMGTVIYVILALGRNVYTGTVTDFLLLPLNQPVFLAAILYLGLICSVVCLFLCNFGIKHIGSAGFTSFIGIETVTSIFAGVLILHEKLSAGQITGAVLIIIGVYLANTLLLPKKESPLPDPRTDPAATIHRAKSSSGPVPENEKR